MRAVSWNLGFFDKVGGSGTLRRIWIKLKGEGKTYGRKRQASETEESEAENQYKRRKRSLDVSDTCDRIRELLLSNDRSLDSDDASEYDTQDVNRVPSECNYGAGELEFDYRSVCGENICHDNHLVEPDEFHSGWGFDYISVGGENIYQDNPLIDLDERHLMNESSSIEDLRFWDFENVRDWEGGTDSTYTSVPELATTESSSSEQELHELDNGRVWSSENEVINGGATSDSGVSESLGLITNLCPTRRPTVWSRGLVTVTSDRPPLTVGLSDASLNEWEDLCDLDGNPTGVEVMELNIRSGPGRTGSYADDFDIMNEMRDGFDHMLLMMGRDRRLSDEDRIWVMHWVANVIVEMVVWWFLYNMAERERWYNTSEWEMLQNMDQFGNRGRSGAEQGGGTCSAELNGIEASSEANREHILDVMVDSFDGYGIQQAQSDDESGYRADIDSSSDVE